MFSSERTHGAVCWRRLISSLIIGQYSAVLFWLKLVRVWIRLMLLAAGAAAAAASSEKQTVGSS